MYCFPRLSMRWLQTGFSIENIRNRISRFNDTWSNTVLIFKTVVTGIRLFFPDEESTWSMEKRTGEGGGKNNHGMGHRSAGGLMHPHVNTNASPDFNIGLVVLRKVVPVKNGILENGNCGFHLLVNGNSSMVLRM